jgi:F-type H+-transporting ATPase subunit gamma
MSSLSDLARRLTRLGEVRAILTAMKNLSVVETRKLARFITQQRRMLQNIEAAAADFRAAYPEPNSTDVVSTVIIVIGSERGFCGNFNERVVGALSQTGTWKPTPSLIAVGHRLVRKLAEHPMLLGRLDGATTTEAVPAVLDRLMDALHAARGRIAAHQVDLYCLSVTADADVALRRLLPIPVGAGEALRRHRYPPRLNEHPDRFFLGLLDQYLLAALHGCLFESLAAENRQRLAHMEHALERVDQSLAGVAHRRNALRREKIIEEIEVTLSSAKALGYSA